MADLCNCDNYLNLAFFLWNDQSYLITLLFFEGDFRVVYGPNQRRPFAFVLGRHSIAERGLIMQYHVSRKGAKSGPKVSQESQSHTDHGEAST
jgi:hypothetical protein